MATPEERKPYEHYPDFEKEGEPAQSPGAELVDSDEPKSAFHPYAMALIDINRKMYDHTFNISSASSSDLKDRFDEFADDIERLVVQLEAIDMDVIESRGMKYLLYLLSNYSAFFRSAAEGQTTYDAKKYQELIRHFEDHMNFAQSLIHLLGLSRGDALGIEESFLDKHGMFGNVEARSFSVGPSVHQIKRILHMFRDSLHDNHRKFPMHDKEMLTNAGGEIKKIIEMIAENFDNRAPEHHLQRIFRMVGYQLALALDILTHDLKLPQNMLITEKWASVFKKELDLISKRGISQQSPIDALSGAVTLLTLLYRVSTKNKNT